MYPHRAGLGLRSALTTEPTPTDARTDDGATQTDVAPGLLAALPAAAATVRRAGFARLLQHDMAGGAVLAADTGLSAEMVRDAVALLERTGIATVDHEGRVVGVGGLSLVPTAHQLLLDGQTFWTWCAFDAVGIPAALGIDAVARSRCGHCGDRLDVTLTAGRPPADSAVVGWLPGHACTNVQVDFCPAANLFCDHAHLSAWRDQAGNPLGGPATLPTLATLGAQVWAEMAPPAASGSGQH